LWRCLLSGIFGNPTPHQPQPFKALQSSRSCPERGHGSGVYIGDGLVITAAHVVTNIEGDFKVKTETGNVIKAELLWSSAARDVALIRVSGTNGLSVARLDCVTPQVGERIHARGNPLSVEFFSTWGHVSTVQRTYGHWLEAVGVNMTVLPGMSGGPVFGESGAVVGIAVGVLMAPSGFGSAAPTGVGLIVPGSTICQLLGR
jgi:S1-C subfamily serine protease